MKAQRLIGLSAVGVLAVIGTTIACLGYYASNPATWPVADLCLNVLTSQVIAFVGVVFGVNLCNWMRDNNII